MQPCSISLQTRSANARPTLKTRLEQKPIPHSSNVLIIISLIQQTVYPAFSLHRPSPLYSALHRSKIVLCLSFLVKIAATHQRWSLRGRSRGRILKSLALASKVKSLALASRPQVLENWPVFGLRTTLFFELLKFCGALEKFFGKRFLWR